MSRQSDAVKFNERGNSCREAGNWQAAIELYEQAASLAPKWSSPHYNLGLVYKYRKQWKESFDCNLRATALDPKDEASWWNLGIAATGLGDWSAARKAWRGFGIEIPAGRGPIDFPCGIAPIRLNPDGPNTEVVWADRLCPARARIQNIPLPESCHRWGDVVLNDGAPVGSRMLHGREIGVFNELQLIESSSCGTYVVEVEAPQDGGWFESLDRLTAARKCAVEDWSTSLHLLCKACSEGRPHHEHDSELEIPKSRQIAIAARSLKEAKTLLADWIRKSTRIRLGKLEELAPPDESRGQGAGPSG